jgi:hypothetical protein
MRTFAATRADVNERQSKNLTSLHAAAQFNHVAACRLLVRYGVDVNCFNDRGNTPLHVAAQYGALDVCRFLLDRNAAVNQRNCHGVTALLSASAFGRVDVCRLLLERGAEVNHPDSVKPKSTPLYDAARRNHADVCRLLLEHGADWTWHTTGALDAIECAAHLNNLDVCRVLLMAGVGGKREQSRSPLLADAQTQLAVSATTRPLVETGKRSASDLQYKVITSIIVYSHCTEMHHLVCRCMEEHAPLHSREAEYLVRERWHKSLEIARLASIFHILRTFAVAHTEPAQLFKHHMEGSNCNYIQQLHRLMDKRDLSICVSFYTEAPDWTVLGQLAPHSMLRVMLRAQLPSPYIEHHLRSRIAPDVCPWYVQRLLWIAALKETTSSCPLACLPAELIYRVISLVHWWYPDKDF